MKDTHTILYEDNTYTYQLLLCKIIFLRGDTSDIVCVVHSKCIPDSHS